MAGTGPGVTPREIDIRFGGQHRIIPITFSGIGTASDQSLWSRLGVLYGWSAFETTGAAPARARLYDGADTSGQVLGNIGMPANDESQMWMGDHGCPITVGVFLHVVTGTLDLTVYIAAADPPLDPS